MGVDDNNGKIAEGEKIIQGPAAFSAVEKVVAGAVQGQVEDQLNPPKKEKSRALTFEEQLAKLAELRESGEISRTDFLLIDHFRYVVDENDESIPLTSKLLGRAAVVVRIEDLDEIRPVNTYVDGIQIILKMDTKPVLILYSEIEEKGGMVIFPNELG